MNNDVNGVFSADNFLDDACCSHYHREGWVLIKGFYDYEHDLQPIFRHINHLVALKLKALGIEVRNVSDREIDNSGFQRVASLDRSLAGEIYRACRHLWPLHKLLMKSESLALVSKLMDTSFVNVIPYTPIRIDIPGEEQYLFPWHQDYPYIQGSMDGVVLWTPLVDVPIGSGNVEVIPGSHHQGLQRVEVLDAKNTNKNGAHTVRIENMDRYNNCEAVAVDVSPGDVLVFHTLCVHRSTPSTQKHPRWTTQLRYANFSNSDAVARGWPGGMIEGREFGIDHPEFVVPQHELA